MCQEQTYSLPVEKLLDCSVRLREQYICVLFEEISRLNHLLGMTCHAMVAGGCDTILWALS
jgi:NADH:ubiquinone oxidoreductase subunit D